MKIINLLDEKTINKIAAGEVVERPLSIVKELVENSIDSGATEITIEVKRDPLRYIRISDNGLGIAKQDLEAAFMRHATSKIKTINDVECIRSLGFRGEALSSISAISKVEMITKPKKEAVGRKIIIEGGKLLNNEDAGSPNGTIITVRDVFFNTPARLKFLKSTSRELSAITDLVEKIALSNINICIRYKIDEKLIFLTPGNSDLKGIISTIFGKKVYNEIVFVNGRIVKSPLISSAVEKAYKSMLPINKFPFFVLTIEVNPKFIDVNVHPTKAEIKFQDDQLVYKKIFTIIKKHISEKFNINDAFEENVYKESVYKENVKYIQGELNYNTIQEQDDVKVNVDATQINKDPQNITLKSDSAYIHKGYENYREESLGKMTLAEDIQNKQSKHKEECIFLYSDKSGESINLEIDNRIPNLKILGQINSTYIIAEGMKEMYIIDQHAAHERIYYEKYMKEFEEFSIKSQPLLVPLVECLSISEKQLLLSNLEAFKRIGFTIDDFGGESIAIREIPLLYGNPDSKLIFNEIMEDIQSSKEKKIVSCIDKIIYSMACRSSVKAGDNLKNEEIQKLIESLRGCYNPYTCPHGRPTIIKMSYLELEKKFKRI
ncbi:MAG: DNA mismatch repair endonuclease MutL [Clostridium sp.]